MSALMIKSKEKMIVLTMPDGKKRESLRGITGDKIASSIHKKLAKEAVAIKINGTQWDLDRPIEVDAAVEIITKNSKEGLEILRHDTAHLLAQAVKELFPDAQVTIGPAIENGFYYDFFRKIPFSSEDFSAIEKHMNKIIDRNDAIIRDVWSRDKAIEYFRSIGEDFKVELVESIPAEEDISIYTQGKFTDLCRGPHLPSTGRLSKHFKLMKLAGSYWRGDSSNPMLQRMYGTAWATDQQLKDYLKQIEEAEKRDHRKIGREMNLFHFQKEAPGSVFWHPNGWKIYVAIQDYLRDVLDSHDYREVNTPILVDSKLWKDSGHWEKFRESMFTLEADEKIYALKPMNCPCHVQIFNQGIKSYRDLPLRLAEFGSCQRHEASGALHGLMRVRAFVQDDAHIFCRESQIMQESLDFCDLLMKVYKDFGFEDVCVKFSDRPEVRAGNDATWDKAEEALKDAIEKSGLPYTLNPGEGAFYGPKLEFVLRDAIGRDWQLGTLQVDFVLPERLGANYVGEDGEKHIPVMLHRAIFGSFERFIGVLIENYAGKIPLWLAPEQIAIVPVTSDSNRYGEEVLKAIEKAGLRGILDIRNENVSYKVRKYSLKKVPFIFVVGDREAKDKQVCIRQLGSQKQEIESLDKAVEKLRIMAKRPQGAMKE